MEYNFTEIEKKWRQYWRDQQVYKVANGGDKPKCYVLDMFPYPSGAGLHVGHPLGYIASDIYSRYKRLKGYNVLHPMGFDAFGLPAEQYAIETGQHPAKTTEENIKRYKEQLDNIGFCYDWSREVRTSDPKYYKWTQWIFLQLFESWYDRTEQKARPIAELVGIFEREGNAAHVCPGDDGITFSADEWSRMEEKDKRNILMLYRIAYQGYADVWWCETLGTVLANDEVVNGVSERGGHPVERKRMRQWFLRITEYADRLLDSLEGLDWTDAMKEMQRNWIGKSSGAEVRFYLSPALSEGEGGGAQDPASDRTGVDAESDETSKTRPAWNTAEPTMFGLMNERKEELKRNATEAETILWSQLKTKGLGAKFRRQHIIGRYIVDFVCLPAKLVVEVDGNIHEHQEEHDARRTQYLEEKGYRVIRFTNEAIISDIDNVLSEIKKHLLTDDTSLSFGEGRGEVSISVFTTRPDTIFGVDFMVLAPEHELVESLTTEAQKASVDEYRQYVKSRSERERMSEVKQVTGCFTGSYVIHPFSGKEIPVWISEYVLAGYGTGAIMAVPAGDERDNAFAKHFEIPITNIFGESYTGDGAYSEKSGTIENSGFLSGMHVAEAIEAAIVALEEKGIGKRRVNYRLRDAGFSRQRYWGEPFPIVYDDDIAYSVDNDHDLPVELPHVDTYKPGPEGQGPLANIEDWVNVNVDGRQAKRETNTMPGYAGSSWYFLRYMDPGNEAEFASRAATDYWQQVDLYVGGTEHAVGHLLYARMWTKVLYDLGYIGFDEPFKKLLNQGMIQGKSYYFKTVVSGDGLPGIGNIISGDKKIGDYPQFVGNKQFRDGALLRMRYGQDYVDGAGKLTFERYADYLKTHEGVSYDFIWDEKDGHQYILLKEEVEKMSKSKYNVVNPDDIVAQYGADTFRMYEMFLGPIDVSKPWDTKGIEGVHRFLKKFWRLYYADNDGAVLTDDAATDDELRTLHKTIKKVGEDIERFSFNTSVSQFMICVNELSGLNCHKRAVLEPLVILLSPFAPHIAEELWQGCLKNSGTVLDAAFPEYNEQHLKESSVRYPVAINGKRRVDMEFAADAARDAIEAAVLADATIQKWMEGKPLRKFIFVPGKMINVVI